MTARAAGVQAIDGPHLGVSVDEAFRASVLGARRLGFDGKWVIHPRQIGDPAARTGHRDNLDAVGAPPGDLAQVVSGWRLDRLPSSTSFGQLTTGQTWRVGGGDVVSSAPELARLTLNVASVHHDAAAAGGTRLVYGGHTIGLALAQATRALPGIVTVAGWHGCDHLGPVHEGDTLHSTVTVESVEPLPDAGALVHLRSRVWAAGPEPREVLDWRYVVVHA